MSRTFVALIVLLAGCGPPPQSYVPAPAEVDLCGQPTTMIDPGGALILDYQSVVGPSFEFVGVCFTIDGMETTTCQSVMEDGSIPPVSIPEVSAGPRWLGIVATYKGQGEGVFDYVNDYRFTIEAEIEIATRPQGSHVKVAAREPLDPTIPLVDRIQFFVRVDGGDCMRAETIGSVTTVEDSEASSSTPP
jgi:hypothetical protein